MKILIAEDETSIREVVTLYLKKEGYTVYAAADGEEALDLEIQHCPDLLLLDIMLPKLSGLEVCKSITRSVPIIFLTAKNEENDKIIGFGLGADDYITKPFSPRELIARVKAVLRRTGKDSGESIVLGGLTVFPAEKSIAISGEKSVLSPKEFELLFFLLKHPRQTFSREQLLTNIWGYDFDGDERTVDATIKRLRQKLTDTDYHYIHTVRGFGYQFEVLQK